MTSSGSSRAASSSTTRPVIAAGTITQTARGGSSFATSCSSEAAPMAPSPLRSCTASGFWSYTTHSWPSRVSRRTRFAPMRPSPIIPSCISSLLQDGAVPLVAVATDQGVGRAVVGKLGDRVVGEFRGDPFRERFAELDTPLVEGVDPPDHALREDAVLVERHQLAERLWSQPLEEDRVGRPVALEDAVRNEPPRRPLGLDLGGRLAEGERLGLREHVRREQIVLVADRVQCLRESDEVAGDEPRPLVDELVEAVLAVGAGFAPVDRSCLVVDPPPVERDGLTVRLHRQLL